MTQTAGMTRTAGAWRAGRVVVGVDGSDHSLRAAEWAAAEAARRGVGLIVLHADGPEHGGGSAPHPDSAHEEHRRVLREVEERVRTGYPRVDLSVRLVQGGAAQALVEASRAAGLVVVGFRGRGGFGALAVGSTSLKVAAHAHCPAVVVRGHAHGVNGGGPVVLGLDHDTDPEAARFAMQEAAQAGVEVVAIRAWVPYPSHADSYISDTDYLARLAADDMVAMLKPLRQEFPGVHVRISVRRGHPAFVLAEASRGARLTVVAAHHPHGLFSLGIGSVVQGVLAHAKSPVVVVPGGHRPPTTQ